MWRRLFRDTTRGPGLTRRAGAVLIAGGWVLAIAALVAERSGAPFWLQQVLAWPGFLWLALSIYLLLGVVAGEVVRPLLRWFLERRARGPRPTAPTTSPGSPGDGAAGAPASVTATAPTDGGTVTAAPAPAAQAGPAGAATVSASAAGRQAGHGAGTPSAASASASASAPATAASAPAPQAGPAGAATVSAATDGGGVTAASGVAPTSPAPQTDPTGAVAASVAAPHPQVDGGGASGAAAAAPAAEQTASATAAPGEAAAGDTPTGPSRRLFVSRVVAGAAAAAAVGTVGYGTYGVLRGPQVKRVTVPLAKLPRAAHGYRIAVVSDIHLGPVLGRGFAQKVVDTINATQPDLIAVVGDLVDGSVKDLGPAAAPLAQLRARHGSYFVTGNHEYFSGAEQWVEEVRRLGLHPLENARREMPYFDLAGVNDVAGEEENQGPDFARALGDRDTARACVLLAHQPVQIHEAVEHGVDLQLSGHTHGGQLWPGNLIASGANPTLAGLDRYGDTQLYVSRGAGAWGPPTRVGAPSDITVIELASKQA
ncbi:integral membrane protein [Streptomyces viridochromogenes DSM 40736]|uniref:Integral membrane protein n=1 Tax=Streptomyces viridochromogenes (strain DSM 40736 / JCM 4977 / BCRC 1201 / Tue 494) TaxID=591159 RepID=D9XB71_STRVT|nr:integral membrane protein [Streptomyces viridochromogenes DSM 40736]